MSEDDKQINIRQQLVAFNNSEPWQPHSMVIDDDEIALVYDKVKDAGNICHVNVLCRRVNFRLITIVMGIYD